MRAAEADPQHPRLAAVGGTARDKLEGHLRNPVVNVLIFLEDIDYGGAVLAVLGLLPLPVYLQVTAGATRLQPGGILLAQRSRADVLA